MHKLLITGIEQTLGSNLAAALADRAEIVGLHALDRPVRIASITSHACELDDPQALHDAVLEFAPQSVIHCGRCAQARWDVAAGEASIDADHEAALVVSLADATLRLRSKLTVISTDAVFTGPRLFHEENETASATGALANAARAVEDALAATPALIVRTCAYGWNLHGAPDSFAERLWHRLADGSAPQIDALPHATPILATDLAELLWLAAQRGLEGLYHITGAERTSLLRFASELASLAGFDAPQVATMAPTPDSTPVRVETSLNTRRARRLIRTAMPLLREGLDRFVAQKRGEYLTIGQEHEMLVTGGRAA